MSGTLSDTILREKEREFHDDWASSIDYRDVKVRETFSVSTSPEPRWIAAQLGDLTGRKVLELGSGAGEGAVYFALQGADVTATDLSPGMLQVVRKVAEHHNTHVKTNVCSADDLSDFDDESFDVVYGANLLHHVDIEKCLDEVKRVLRPGGLAAFWDPLAHNPVINAYRRMANEVRTEDEHPIRRSEMDYFTDRFATVQRQFFWLTTLSIFLKFYLIDRVHPNQDRYWKRIISREPELRRWYKPLAAFDRTLLTVFPFLGWWCWNIAIVARKK